MKDSKLDKVLEGYKPIPMKRLFYPRGMQLSEEFINAFHREYDRLVSEGINPKTLVERVGKAMKFHINDPRKYKILDEAQAKLEEATKPKKGERKADRRKGKQQTAAEIAAAEAEKQDKDERSAVEGKHGQGTDSGITQS